jgi:Ras-related protein Rab-2A
VIQVRKFFYKIKKLYNIIAVGKSNILSKYTHGKFNPDHEITIGCEFMAKNLSIKDRNIRIQIWDTAGQEAFRSITRSYYKNSTCAFIVYDITSRKTFDNVMIWLKECKDMCYKDILICLVGNKCDLEGRRAVSYEEGEKFATDNQLLFFETSAKDGNNIAEMFTESATILVDKIESGQLNLNATDSGIKIGKYPNSGESAPKDNEKKKKNCC